MTLHDIDNVMAKKQLKLKIPLADEGLEGPPKVNTTTMHRATLSQHHASLALVPIKKRRLLSDAASRFVSVLVILIIMSVMTVESVFADQLWYRAKPGESLSSILDSLGVCPLWGRENAVTKTLALNKRIKARSSGSLHVGEKIRLPVTDLPGSEKYAEVYEDGEVRRIGSSVSICRAEEVTKRSEPKVELPKTIAPTPIRYQLQPGETVSSILDTLGVCPLWGKGKAVERTLRVNGYDPRKGGADVFPYSWIALPVFSQELGSSTHYKVDNRGILVFSDAQRDSQCRSSGGVTARANVRKSSHQASRRVSRAPASAEVPAESAPERVLPEVPVDFRISLGLKSGFVALFGQSVESKATGSFASDLGYGYLLRAQIDWDHHYTTRFELEGNRIKFLAAGTRSLTDASMMYNALSARQEIHLPWGFSPFGEAIFAQRPGYFSTDRTSFTFDRILTPYLGVGLKKTLLEGARFSVGLDFSYLYLQPISTQEYDVAAGKGLRYGIYMSVRTLGGFMLTTEFNYATEKQPNSILLLDRKSAYFQFLFSLPSLK